MKGVKRISIVGCPCDVISLEQTIGQIINTVRSNGQLRVVPLNVDVIMKAKRLKEFMKDLWEAPLVVADGVPVVWAASLLGEPVLGRINGTDLVWQCARISAENGLGIAMIGGESEVCLRAASMMRSCYTKASLYPIPTPAPLSEADSEIVVSKIKASGAEIVLAGLGAPRQERWLKRYLDQSGANVGIAVGGSFDIISGDKRRAPRWMQEYGLEWLHRLILEPRRLGKRYVLEDSPFLWHVAYEVFTRRVEALCKKARCSR